MVRKSNVVLIHEKVFKNKTDIQILKIVNRYIYQMSKDEFYKRSYNRRTFHRIGYKYSPRFYAKHLLDIINMPIVSKAFSNKTKISNRYTFMDGLEKFYKGTIKETKLLDRNSNLKYYAYMINDAITYHTDRYNIVMCPKCGNIMDFYHTTWKYNIKCNNCGNTSKGVEFKTVYTPGKYKITDYKRLELYKQK